MEQTGESHESVGGEPTLRRSISLWQMTLYGAGGMLGAGIYGLIGQVAAEMGSAIWLAFAFSLVAAGLTGLSYASLGSRYPRAGGAAYITQRAYRRSLLTHIVGLTVACSGLTSIAAGARVVGENLQALAVFEGLPTGTLAFIYVAIVGGIAYRGIRESMWANVALTLMEAGGLLLVIAVSLRFWGSANLLEFPVGPETEAGLPLVFLAQGIVLTFYAFIGFEDSLNVAEELKNPRRNLPLGLIMALLLTVVIYMSVAIQRRLGRALAGVGRGQRAAGRSRGARRTLVPGVGVHRDYRVRGRQHRSDQLRHGVASALRHGARRAPAARTLESSSGAAHAAHRYRADLRADRDSHPVGRHFGTGLGDRIAAAVGVPGGEQCTGRPEAAARRTPGRFRTADRSACARRGRLRRDVRNPRRRRRLARAPVIAGVLLLGVAALYFVLRFRRGADEG